MKIMSLNIRGFGVKGKFGWVKELCCKERPDIAVFQEAKCRNHREYWVQDLWGSSNCGFVQKEAVGNSGGLLIVWDSASFSVEGAVSNEFFVVIRGKWIGSGHESIIVNAYGPHTDEKKNEFWSSLDEIMNKIDSTWVTRGDFNEFMRLWVDLLVVPLDRRDSDHCPLLLRDRIIDFGPKAFNIFDEWFKKEGVDKVIIEAWGKDINISWRDCIFRDRLKNVKSDLKIWSKKEFGNLDGEINDGPGANGTGIFKLSNSEAGALEDKFCESEIWEAVKGCSSSKAPRPDDFNMGFYKKFWYVIKDDLIDAVNLFWERGEISKGCNASFVTLIPKMVDPLCLSDYRSISLIGSYYKVIAKLLSNRLKKVVPNLVGPEQSAFIKGRNILDGVSEENIRRLMKLLKCFELTSGLMVNYHKSNLIVVGIDKDEVENMAKLFGCKVGTIPFMYLGLPVGGNMKRAEYWKPVMDKFEKRLSDWRARSGSFDGRLTLVKSVLNRIPLYYLSFFCTPPCMIKQLESCEYDIEDFNIPFRKLFVKDKGDGASTSFWDDIWLGEEALSKRFKRLVRLENDLRASVRDRLVWDGIKCTGNWSWAIIPSGHNSSELHSLNELLVGAVMEPLKQDSWR
ncbi:uncharacterized protein [Rutidosis leptorrhynchoides]|uniref:uncharacterized protein n=1 Tax=Rutidosis leptorrhynchoides TaxID=125765 RepID=UPI003A99C074